jgi:hypothetical protein
LGLSILVRTQATQGDIDSTTTNQHRTITTFLFAPSLGLILNQSRPAQVKTLQAKELTID